MGRSGAVLFCTPSAGVNHSLFQLLAFLCMQCSKGERWKQIGSSVICHSHYLVMFSGASRQAYFFFLLLSFKTNLRGKSTLLCILYIIFYIFLYFCILCFWSRSRNSHSNSTVWTALYPHFKELSFFPWIWLRHSWDNLFFISAVQHSIGFWLQWNEISLSVGFQA